MKVDFSQEILDMSGVPIMDNGQIVTLRTISVNALLAPEQQIEGSEKMKRFVLAQKVHDSDGEMELCIEDAKLIKEQIGKNFATLVVGRAWKMLEG